MTLRAWVAAASGLLVGLGALALAAPESFLRSPQLGLASKGVATAGILGIWIALLGVFMAARRLVDDRTAGRRRRWLVAAVLVALLPWAFLGIMSWVLFVRKGFFVNAAMLGFLAQDPIHLVALLTREERRISFVVMALAAALLGAAWKGAASFPSGRGTAVVGLGGTTVALAAFAVYPVALPEPVGREYRKQVCYHSTPGLSLLCSALARAPEARLESRGLVPLYRGLGPYLQEVPSPPPRAWNVVIIVVESWRRDSLRSLGAPQSLMPYTDTAAERGLLFSNAYSQSNLTNYSVPSMLSSLHPLKFPVKDAFLNRDYPKTLVYDVLKPLGYRTGIFSSHNDNWFNMGVYMDSPALDVYFHPETYDGPTLIPKEDSGFFRLVALGHLKKGNLDDRVPVERFLVWVREGRGPFAAYLNFQATHFPYEQATDMDAPFQPHALDFPASFFAYPREKLPVMRNRYWNSLRFVDARIRDVVEGLREAGQGDNTIFVIVGDHGQSFGENGAVTHGQHMPEEVLRVPLLILGPEGVVPVRVDDRPIQLVDVVPTLLALMGLPAHPNFQGIDVLDPARDPGDHKLFLSTQQVYNQHVLVWRGYKYLLNREGDDRFFFLPADPEGRHDLIRARPEEARRHREVLQHFVDTQLAYYAQPELRHRFFPPKY